MSEGTGLPVECDVCGTAFDPTAAGGWCTNPECGEWKYDGDVVPDPPDESATGDTDDQITEDEPAVSSETTSSGIVDPEPEYSEVTTAHDQDAAVQDADSEANDEEPDAVAVESGSVTDSAADVESASEGIEEESEGVEEESGAVEEEDDDAGESVEGSDEAGEPVAADDEADESVAADDDTGEAVEGSDGTGEVAETDDVGEAVETRETEDPDAGTGTDDGTDDAEITCPGCAETLDAATNFCPNCGEDVSAVEPGDSDEMTACPACGDDVDPDDNFCASCGENLDDHRSQTPLTECPDCGATVDEKDSFCADCGENLDEHRKSGSAGSPATDAVDPVESQSADAAPESLLLTTRGREIAVTDGETVGRKLREIITETGGDENDAVRIHREHIRFVREDGQFYLVDLGENPTEVNGSSLAKGDRKRISPGDEITLSDVATLTVTHP